MFVLSLLTQMSPDRDSPCSEGAHNLVEMDIATDLLTPRVVGETDTRYWGSWTSAHGTWVGKRSASVVFTYVDRFTETVETRTQLMDVAADGASLTWFNGTSEFYGRRQLYTHVRWWRCEIYPDRCTGTPVSSLIGVQRPSVPRVLCPLRCRHCSTTRGASPV